MIQRYDEVEGRYIDSVLLMQITRDLEKEKGVSKAAVMTGSRANLEVMRNIGFEPPSGVKDTSVIIAVEADSDEAAKAAIDKAFDLMDRRTQEASAASMTLDDVGTAIGKSDLPVVFISTPGEHVKEVASKALDAGAHVHIFSSNVPLETEVMLKRKGHEKGLLVMGPDAGTTILNGKGLGFANAVRRGDVGIVGSSGTGIQELSVLLHKGGLGVSAAIGVGSADLSAEIDGITTKDAVAILKDSRYLFVIAKKPDEKVRREIVDMMKDIPSSFISLGESGEATTGKTYQTGYIDDAVAHALRELGMKPFPAAQKPPRADLNGRRLLRGFFVGGSICYQAQAILARKGTKVHSNAPADKAYTLPPDWKDLSVCIDTGAEEYVVGKPHPMIDPKARNAMVVEESKRPEVAVILIDVVLGFGSAQDLLEGLEGLAKGPIIIASICGTDDDKQGYAKVRAGLEKIGALVFDSAGQAAEYAGDLMKGASG